jgi:hypothetical protein
MPVPGLEKLAAAAAAHSAHTSDPAGHAYPNAAEIADKKERNIVLPDTRAARS